MKEKSAEKKTNMTPPPSATQRSAAKARIVENVSSWLAARIDEVFEMADEGADQINWGDLEEVREQICGCLADDLDHDLGELVDEILEAELVPGGVPPPCLDAHRTT